MPTLNHVAALTTQSLEQRLTAAAALFPGSDMELLLLEAAAKIGAAA